MVSLSLPKSHQQGHKPPGPRPHHAIRAVVAVAALSLAALFVFQSARSIDMTFKVSAGSANRETAAVGGVGVAGGHVDRPVEGRGLSWVDVYLQSTSNKAETRGILSDFVGSEEQQFVCTVLPDHDAQENAQNARGAIDQLVFFLASLRRHNTRARVVVFTTQTQKSGLADILAHDGRGDAVELKMTEACGGVGKTANETRLCKREQNVALFQAQKVWLQQQQSALNTDVPVLFATLQSFFQSDPFTPTHLPTAPPTTRPSSPTITRCVHDASLGGNNLTSMAYGYIPHMRTTIAECLGYAVLDRVFGMGPLSGAMVGSVGAHVALMTDGRWTQPPADGTASDCTAPEVDEAKFYFLQHNHNSTQMGYQPIILPHRTCSLALRIPPGAAGVPMSQCGNLIGGEDGGAPFKYAVVEYGTQTWLMERAWSRLNDASQSPCEDDKSRDDQPITVAHHPTTVVTGLWNINREQKGDGRPWERYHSWFSMMLSIKVPMVVFVPSEFVDFVRKHRENMTEITVIHVLEVNDLPYYPMVDEWQKILDSKTFREKMEGVGRLETRYALYDAVIFSKFPLVERVSRENPFNSRYFFWVDAGNGRWMRSLLEDHNDGHWPGLARIRPLNEGKMIIMSVAKTEQRLPEIVPDEHMWVKQSWLQAGIFGGTASTMAQVRWGVQHVVEEYTRKGVVNNEQIVLYVLRHRHPDWFHVINRYCPPNGCRNWDEWPMPVVDPFWFPMPEMLADD